MKQWIISDHWANRKKHYFLHHHGSKLYQLWQFLSENNFPVTAMVTPPLTHLHLTTLRIMVHGCIFWVSPWIWIQANISNPPTCLQERSRITAPEKQSPSNQCIKSSLHVKWYYEKTHIPPCLARRGRWLSLETNSAVKLRLRFTTTPGDEPGSFAACIK